MQKTCWRGSSRRARAWTRPTTRTRRSRSCRSSPTWRRRSRRSCSAPSARPRRRPRRSAPSRMPMPLAPSELRTLVEGYLDELALTPELSTLAEPMRHGLGGKRVRPVLCLATGEALGARPESLLPAAAAVELVHSFALVHDRERRGSPSVWAQYGEAAAILAGDALRAEAFRLALSYPGGAVARELVDAALAMIGGQWLDIRGDGASDELHRLKTGALFSAAVGCALAAVELPLAEQAPWRTF